MLYVTTLPDDWARCFNSECKKKVKCLRFLDRYRGKVRNNFNHKDCNSQIKPKKNGHKN